MITRSTNRSEIVDLHAEFQCITGKSNWSIGRARLLNWEYRPQFGEYVEIEIVMPQDLVGARIHVAATDLPPGLQGQLPSSFFRLAEELSEEIESTPLEVLIGTYPASGKEVRHVNTNELLTEFFGMDQDSRELRGFLRRYGAWDARSEPTIFDEGTSRPLLRKVEAMAKALEPRRNGFSVLLPEVVWRRRSEISWRIDRAIEDGSSAWFALSDQNESPFQFQRNFPYYFHVDHYCQEAIETAITLKYLQDHKWAKCAKENCKRPFIVSERKTKFHDNKCAVAAASKRYRNRDKR